MIDLPGRFGLVLLAAAGLAQTPSAPPLAIVGVTVVDGTGHSPLAGRTVLVRDGRIIGRGHNRRVQNGDPMAHAEIDCFTNAGRQKTYADTVLYSTLMPCYLCTGAVIQFGVPKVVVGESVNFCGGEGKWGTSPDFMRANGVEVIDLHDAACIEMMSTFIRENPRLWNEDIGVD